MFMTFFKIGAFTIGGGYAMIPIIQEEVVEKKSWIEEEEFLDIIAVAQGSPGPVAINTSIFVGYRLKGLRGAITCMLATALPSFLIILLIAMVFFQHRNNPVVEKVFFGIRPAVVALIGSAVYKMYRSSRIKGMRLLIAILSTAIIVFTNISPIYLILAGGIGAILYYRNKERDVKS